MKYIVETEFTFLVCASEICSWISVNCDLHQTSAENRDPRKIKESPGSRISRIQNPRSRVRKIQNLGSRIRNI